MDELKTLGGPDWFNLGDRDLAKHVLRGEWLRQGWSLSAVTAELARRQGIPHHHRADERRSGPLAGPD
jgi:LPPG:FO 2-phospho-L-lactate transferase